MYEIFAYQNAESLTGIFNMIAAIVGSSDYLGAIALVAFFGFVVAFIAYAFQPERLHGWKWLGTVVVVYSILFVPRVTVQVTDRTGSNPPSIIDNVPLGVALFGSMTSQVGNLLTELFETAAQVLPGPAQLPVELSYQQNGLMFGSRLIKYTRNLVFTNPVFRTDLIAFIDNCTKYDLMDGTIDPVAFSSSADVWSLMGSPNPARFTPVTSGAGAPTVMTCPDAYAILDVVAGVEATALQARLGQQLNPTLTAAAASAAIGNQITVAYQRNQLANAAATASQIVLQNAMINALNDASQIIGQKSNDPASLLLAMGRAQAVAQTNAAWINYGKVAEEALPLIRNVVEAICYALFPVMILLLFMTSGMQTLMALKSYVVTLLWIQLWPPVYAVLNYMATVASAAKLAASADIGGGATAMALQTASSVYSNAISLEAVVGYMVISIPAIAWAAIKGMETIGQAAITGTSSMQGAISAATGQAVLGNVGMGNVSMEQQALAPTRTSPFWRKTQDDVSGHTWTTSMFGGRAVDLLSNSGPLSLRAGSSRNAAAEEHASRSVQAAREEMLAATRERQAVFADALSHGRARLDTSRFGNGYSRAEIGQFSDTYNEARSVVKDVASKWNLNEADAAALIFQGQAGLAGGYSGRGGRSRSKASGSGGGGSDATTVAEGGQLGVQGAINGALREQYGAQVARDTAIGDTILSPEQAAIIQAYADNYSRDSNFVRAIATDGRDAQEKSARLSRAVGRTERASAALTSAERFAEELRYSSGESASLEGDLFRDPRNTDLLLGAYERFPNSPKMAAAWANSQLAAMGGLSRPITYSDGTAAAWSRRDVEGIHAKDRLDPTVNANVDGEFARMKGETGFRGVGPAPGPGELKDSVDGKIHGAQGDAVRAWNRIELDRAARERTARKMIDPRVTESTPENPGGTFGTGRSLANQAAGMFGQDAKRSVERVAGTIVDGFKERSGDGKR